METQKYQSKIFAFQLEREESVKLLEELKKDQNAFVEAVHLGEQIKKACNEDDIELLKKLINKNMAYIPRIQLFIYEAFEQAVMYRYDEIVSYFLENGYNIAQSEQKLLNTLIQTSRFLLQDPPKELFEQLLQYGADTEEVEQDNYRTPLHLSCKYGIEPFIKILIEKGADVNAIDRKKQTPLFYLQKRIKKRSQNLQTIHDFLQSKASKITYQEELKDK